MIARWEEFFESEDGRFSMSRLLTFMAFWPAAYVVITDGTSDTLSWLLGAYVLQYGAGKMAEFIPSLKKGPQVNIDNSGNVNVTNPPATS